MYKQMMTRIPLRGGSYNNGANAGIGVLNLNNASANRAGSIGFRSALNNYQRQKRKPHGVCGSATLNGHYTLSETLKYGWQRFVSNCIESKRLRYA